MRDYAWNPQERRSRSRPQARWLLVALAAAAAIPAWPGRSPVPQPAPPVAITEQVETPQPAQREFTFYKTLRSPS